MTDYQAPDTRTGKRYTYLGKARKTWGCSYCNGKIIPPQVYEYSYAYGGDDVKRKCEKCLIAEGTL